MNKKGFTLIELIGVIVILALLAVLLTPTVNKVIRNQREKAYNIQLEFIIDASKKYITNNGDTIDIPDSGYIISIDDLYNSGYLDESDLINPVTDEKITQCVFVKWNESYNQYDYTLDEDCTVN